MPSQPLQPFAPPTAVLAHLPAIISAGAVVMWIFYLVFAFWALYTLVIVYHWLKYSHGSAVAYPAIITHLVISFLLMSFALSGAVYI